jgi:hypothetical protein
MNIKMMIATLTIAVLPGLAAAQTTPSDAAAARIDQRQANQQQRIDQGVKSGELNQREAARLQKGQDRVQRKEDKAKADGVITKKEANQIERAQDRQSARIYNQKHDKQKAPK